MILNFLAVYMREMALLQKKMGKLGYIFSAVMFPIIYLFAFGMGIGPVMNNIHGGYLPFLAKGMLSITVMMNAFQQTSLSVSVGRFYFKTFQTLLLSVRQSRILCSAILKEEKNNVISFDKKRF